MQPQTGLAPTTASSLRDRLQACLSQSVEISRELEHGQSARPLSDYFHRLIDENSRDRLSLLIVPLDDVGLRWAQEFSARPVDLTESTAGSNGSSRTQLLRIAIAQIISVDLFSQATAAGCVLVIGSDQTAGKDFEQIALDDLAMISSSFARAVIVPPGDQGSTSNRTASDAEFRVITDEPDASRESMTAWLRSLRETASAIRCHGRTAAAVALVRSIVEQRLRGCDYRRRLLQAKVSGPKRLERDPTQEYFESLRRLWEDRFSLVETQLTERIREQLFPRSKMVNRLKSLQDDLSLDDMVVEHAGKTLRLEAGTDFRQRARQVVERSVEEVVLTDGDWLEQQLESLAKESLTSATSDWNSLPSLNLAKINARNVLDELHRRMELELRYNGEIPRRTWFDWLGQGRRPVFALTMILSIVGTALGFGNVRSSAMLGPVILVLFLAGIGWATVEFREERRMLLQRELLRLRDVVDNELRRKFDELLRDWQARVARWLRETQKDWTRTATDWARDQQIEAAKSLERQRTEGLEQLKLVEGRAREHGQWLGQVDRLEATLREIEPMK